MLLDLMMPRVSGWEILDHLRTWERATRPVVILLTAGTDLREIDPDLVVGSIRKPFDIELLFDTVAACAAALAPCSQFPTVRLRKVRKHPRHAEILRRRSLPGASAEGASRMGGSAI